MDDFAEEEVVENPTIRAAYNLAPLHQNQPLRWDYEVHLIGEKIYDKVIHLCETCELPILVYGRLLPCKHIFCFDCARKCDKSCKRCNLKVQKVEKSALGTVFVCTHGAPKHSTKGCRRTYLSQRDLQAHVAHRHMPKVSSGGSSASSASGQIQPAPNQLPLTKQQAAQQACQKQVGSQQVSQKQVGAQDLHHSSPVHGHLQQPGLAGQGILVPPMPPHHLNHQQQLSPAAQHIPGLGDLRPMDTIAQSVMSHNSPLIQPSASSNALSQGMGLVYGAASRASPDMFHPLDLGQQQQQQQPPPMGISGAHLQTSHPHQPYAPPVQFPPTTGMMQQMNSPQLPNPPLHQATFSHSHPSMPAPPTLDSYSELQNIPPAQQRTNVNLITVPIQDEGQYRPLPHINSTMGPHPGGPYPQTASHSMSGPTLTYNAQSVLPSGTYSTPTTFAQMVVQPPQHMSTSNSPQGLPFNQTNVIRPNNPRPGGGGNLRQGVPRPLPGGMHPMPVGGIGLIPTPGGPAVVNRFPPSGQWAVQGIIQPRLTQGQQQQRPPLTESQFQQGGYYH